MTVIVLAPDERSLREHLASARFRAGIEARHWRLLSLEWPIALISVAAAPRLGSPAAFVLRFDLTGYPQAAPTGGLWDEDAMTYLAATRRPRGERASAIFRSDWEGGRAMYAPWDRVALVGHPAWAQAHPRSVWNARRDLSFLLTQIHDILNSDDYLGV